MTQLCQHHDSPHQKELLARLLRREALGEIIFDVHAHTSSGVSHTSLFDASAACLHREMEALGFTGMAVSAICAVTGVDFKRANDELARDIKEPGNRIAAYVGIDIRLGRDLVPDTLAYLDGGFSGGKIYTLWQVGYDDPRYHEVFELLNARSLPVLAHCWGAADLRGLANAARRFPQISFIAAHTGSADLDVYLESARTIPNLYIDTAYSGGWRGLLEQVVGEIGSEKVVFGSDGGFFSTAQQVARIIAARISDDDRRNILGLNALRLFPDVQPRVFSTSGNS